VNIKEVLKLSPSSRWVVSFSISPSSVAKALDRGTPSVSSRIQALCELRERGHHIALHFDPIVHTAQYLEQYAELIEDLHRREILSSLDYISLGVVRFSKGSYRKMSEHYPDSLIHQGLLVKEGRDKVKYTPALRAKILSSIEQLLTAKGVAQERIYWCME
jgi:spore photoproduct lyase